MTTQPLTPIQLAMAEFTANLAPGNVKNAMREAGASSSDLYKVPRDELHILEGFNIRERTPEYDAHVRELAESMKSEGFYPHSALAGYINRDADGVTRIYVTDGHSRLEAVDLVNAEAGPTDIKICELPIILSAKGTNIEDLTVQLVRRNTGKPLTQFELAMACKRCSNFGWETDKIAKRTGIAKARVEDLLLLMAGPTSITEKVRTGTLAATEAVHQIKTEGAGAAAKVEAMEADRQAKGHKTITAKNRVNKNPDEKIARKEAPSMALLLNLVKNDAGFAALDADLRERIDLLIKRLEPKPAQGTLEGAEGAAADKDAASSNAGVDADKQGAEHTSNEQAEAVV